MRRITVMVTLLSAGIGAGLQAQGAYPECSPYTAPPFTTNDVNLCNAAIDGARVFHPVLGLLTSGGNPVLGGIGSLGGFPHFSLTARVNATRLKTPDLNYVGATPTVGKGDEIFAPAPLVEAALGVFGGVGPMGFLAVDLLGSAQLLPTTQIAGLSVDKNARKIGSIALGLGYGARVGVLRGKAVIPSVTVSAMRRSIPRITFGDVSANNDRYSYSTNLNATNLRVVAGYNLAILAIGAGLGWDKYTGTADLAFAPSSGLPQNINGIKLDNSRTMAFLTAALDLPVIKIGAEIGYQLGKDQNLRTTFAGNNPSEKRLFAGAGIRFAF